MTMSLEPSHVSGPRRRISSRHLGRNIEAVLDEVEREGCSVLIIRYGRPSALLSPVGDDIAVRGPIPAPDEYAEEIADLTDIERRLLLTLVDGECHADPAHNVCEAVEGLKALTKLEIKHFAARGPVGGYTITRLGARVARALVAHTTESPTQSIPADDHQLGLESEIDFPRG
jgi:antitoxin (DNA-binding transcriptional repressor) of toxin-antitoxin stability system